MRRYPAALFTLIALAASATACGRARALESFTLAPSDLIIAESRGCSAECRVVTPQQRTCTVRDYGCRVVCTSLPQCRTDGATMLKVCAVVKDQF